MKKFKIALFFFGILVLAACGYVLKIVDDAGEFKTIRPHVEGPCTIIGGVQSSEDITIHPTAGVALISSTDRRGFLNQGKVQQGAVYAYSLTSGTAKPVNISSSFKKEFHPHGIGLYLPQTGEPSLFAVNHNSSGHFVEIFDFEQRGLVHRESVSGPLLVSPNDVLPVGSNRFYVTNDHGSGAKIVQTVEDFLRLSRADVLYYDGAQFRIVADGIRYANGINMSPDGRTIYVAATTSGEVRVYDRNAASGDLALRRTIPLKTGVDNIEVDRYGVLWIGAHPKLLTYLRYAGDPDRLSPSQVLRLTPEADGTFSVEEMYLNDGSALSGSSVAAVFQNIMLVGSVFDGKFLCCTVPR